MNVALIPVRGGSKSIPLKNIKEMCRRPLVYWTVKAACECEYIDRVYVSTDSDEIKKVVEKFNFGNLRVIGRSPDTATDTASTESVMLEFADKYEFSKVALIQATSPLLTADDLNAGFEKFESNPELDSVLSVVEQKRFNWRENDDGTALPANYDIFHRPRRQEFNGYLVENGAFYITSRKMLLKNKNRISGNIGVVKMSEDTYFEIDEHSDWVIAEALLRERNPDDPLFDNIRLFVTDCDGCLTDGGMYYSENGDELKRFNTKDGMGFRLLRESGIRTAIITGEDRKLNRRRAEKLHIDILAMGVGDKLETLKQMCEQEGIALDEVVYVGDDVNDIDCIKTAGIGVAVSNAEKSVKECADYITKTPGGSGAIREVVNKILKQE